MYHGILYDLKYEIYDKRIYEGYDDLKILVTICNQSKYLLTLI